MAKYTQYVAERISLLGVGVHAVNMTATLDVMAEAISQEGKGYICLAPAHNLMACRADEKLRTIFNRSALTVPDGMGTVWFLRLLGRRAGRVYGPDLMLAACKHGATMGWRHFLLGGAPDVAETLAQRLRTAVPDLVVAGTYSPPFGEMTDIDTAGMLAQVNAARPDLIWVGLGSPKQERWMAEFRGRLDAPLLVGVGAAFDFLSGAKPQAPSWMQRSGMEWLFRLLSEPRRLWKRYAAYPLFVLLVLAQWLGFARYPLEEGR
ncbi:MAG: WecB/TagA/CpsF family glycosyltransferase [Anaerolineales bacterium]